VRLTARQGVQADNVSLALEQRDRLASPLVGRRVTGALENVGQCEKRASAVDECIRLRKRIRDSLRGRKRRVESTELRERDRADRLGDAEDGQVLGRNEGTRCLRLLQRLR
jgi:hypothetical protein